MELLDKATVRDSWHQTWYEGYLLPTDYRLGPQCHWTAFLKTCRKIYFYFSSRVSSLQRSHNLRKFPQIYAVFMGVVLVIMRILCILFKSLLLSHSQPPSPYRNKDMEISCESAGSLSHRLIREFGNRQRRRPKTKSLIGVVYKSAHTLLDFNCLLKYQSFI